MKTYFFYLKEIYQNLLHEFYNSESFENEILHVFYYDIYYDNKMYLFEKKTQIFYFENFLFVCPSCSVHVTL